MVRGSQHELAALLPGPPAMRSAHCLVLVSLLALCGSGEFSLGKEGGRPGPAGPATGGRGVAEVVPQDGAWLRMAESGRLKWGPLLSVWLVPLGGTKEPAGRTPGPTGLQKQASRSGLGCVPFRVDVLGHPTLLVTHPRPRQLG